MKYSGTNLTKEMKDLYTENQKLLLNEIKDINKLKDMNYFVYSADMGGENYQTITYPDKKALVIGNEGKGISRIIEENSDVIVSIPMKGSINSLNASTSAGILIYGMSRND